MSRWRILWRLEPETDAAGQPCILVQSRSGPDWSRIKTPGWLAEADAAIDLNEKLSLDALKAGKRFRFRLRANPCITQNGKRQGLMKVAEQETWLQRKGSQHDFGLPELTAFDFADSEQPRLDVRIAHEHMLAGRQHSGNGIRIYSVLYEGRLIVTDPERFKKCTFDRDWSWKGHGAWLVVRCTQLQGETASAPPKPSAAACSWCGDLDDLLAA